MTAHVFDIKGLKTSCQNCSLAELCLPLGLDQVDVDRLDEIVRRARPMNAGDHLFRTGDAFRSLYAVRAGSVKVYSLDADGEEQILGFHLPGELLGMDAISGKAHACSAKVLETTSVCEIPFERLQELSLRLPSLQSQLFRLLSQEIIHDEAMLLVLGKKPAEERLATFLLSLSERFHRRGFSATEFNLSMSRHDIGNYLGLAVETVSRLFRRFQDDGLLEVQRKHILITDLPRLRAMVHMCDHAEQGTAH
ncbi:MAG: fumarate/nitrate reduction transcriptional regulator Fnr [Chromatiales bacterium]|nr:fumarate/nitrate reduction transcriptional regulator Fnr [Chromatiales bacterium]